MSNSMLKNVCAVIVVVCGSAGATFADTVTMTFNPNPNPSPSAAVKVSINGGSYNGSAGVMNWTVTGVNDSTNDGINPFSVNQPVKTFCIDAQNALTSPDTYTLMYAPFADNNATLFKQLFASHYNQVVDGTTAAAFQLAVWEILYDAPNSGVYNVNTATAFSTGIFKDNGTTSAIITTAKSWLGDFQNTTAAVYNQWAIYELDAGYHGQDQVFGIQLPGTPQIPSVPLPAALPAGMALLGSLGVAKKLRRKA